MNLDIEADKSTFYNLEMHQNDSLLLKQIENQMKMGGNMKVDIRTSVRKKNPMVIKKNKQTLVSINLGIDRYLVKEDQTIQWNIEKETKTIEGYKCQKATTTYSGRKWIAYFSNDIPFINGPYIFGGLPGLIIRLEDEKKDHFFELVSTKKIATVQTTDTTQPIISFKKNGIEITALQFKKAWKEYLNDPGKAMRMMRNSMGQNVEATNVVYKSNDGKTSAIDQRSIEKRQKETLAKDNNYLSLDWFKNKN